MLLHLKNNFVKSHPQSSLHPTTIACECDNFFWWGARVIGVGVGGLPPPDPAPGGLGVRAGWAGVRVAIEPLMLVTFDKLFLLTRPAKPPRLRAEPPPGGRSHLGNLPQPRMRAGGGIPLQGHCTLPTSRSSFSNREIYKCFFSPKRLRLLRVNGDVGATTKSGLRRREVGPLPSLSPVP